METIIAKYSMTEKSLKDIQKSTCLYISGQMSNLPDLGREKLEAAELAMNKAGFLYTLNPYKMVNQTKVPAWCDCMRVDIKDIMNYGVGVCCLVDNWRNSKGATLEVILFLALGVPLFDITGRNITLEVYQSFTPEFIYQRFVEMVETHRLSA